MIPSVSTVLAYSIPTGGIVGGLFAFQLDADRPRRVFENTALGITIGGGIGSFLAFFVYAAWPLIGVLRPARMRRSFLVLGVAVVVAFTGSAVLDALDAPEAAFVALSAACAAIAAAIIVPETITALRNAGGQTDDSPGKPSDAAVQTSKGRRFLWQPGLSTRLASSGKVATIQSEQWRSPDEVLELALAVDRAGNRELFARARVPRGGNENFVLITVREQQAARELLLLASPELEYEARARLGSRPGLLTIEWRPPLLTPEDLRPEHRAAIVAAVAAAREAEIERWTWLSQRLPWLKAAIEEATRQGLA